jgi:hypothetical protein
VIVPSVSTIVIIIVLGELLYVRVKLNKFLKVNSVCETFAMSTRITLSIRQVSTYFVFLDPTNFIKLFQIKVLSQVPSPTSLPFYSNITSAFR